MSPYQLKYKINNVSIAQLCENQVINESQLHQVKQALQLYLSNKTYEELYQMSCNGEEGFPISYAGVPEFNKKEDLLQFAIDMIDCEYDIPDSYVESSVDAMNVEKMKENEKTSNLHR